MKKDNNDFTSEYLFDEDMKFVIEKKNYNKEVEKTSEYLFSSDEEFVKNKYINKNWIIPIVTYSIIVSIVMSKNINLYIIKFIIVETNIAIREKETEIILLTNPCKIFVLTVSEIAREYKK